MKRKRNIFKYFTTLEWLLWVGSMAVIAVAFALFDSSRNYLSLTASLIGVTSLIFCAKGNPVGQVLILVFCGIYGYISYTSAYYGEMITYLGMTAPMAFISLISWLKNPFNGNKSQVRVAKINKKEWLFALLFAAVVTAAFFFILRALSTANLLVSTLSVTTSFLAVYLTFRRSAFYAIAYAANDIVLVALWAVATAGNISYLSVTICFAVFLINDIYGFWQWQRMYRMQNEKKGTD